MEKKMLREISNDKLTPKKSEFVVETEIYKKDEDDGLDYESDYTVLAEF